VLSGRSTEIKRAIIPQQLFPRIMGVHRISFAGALLVILVAIVLLLVIGSVGLLILILAAVLLWYALGPGRRVIVAG
jgi:hypothetical protein